MSGSQNRPPAPPKQGSRPLRRLSQWLPFGVLALVLGATVMLAIERSTDLSATQAQNDELANQEFALELESATQSVQSEIDRLTELIAGITAFAGASDVDTATAVEQYLVFTGAETRFNGLLEAIAHRPVGELVLVDRPGDDPLTPDLQDLVSEVNAELGPRSDPAPMLTSHELGETPVVAVTFGLGADQTAPRVSLVLESEAFLARAMTPTARVSTELINTGRPSEPQAAHQPGDAIETARGDDGSLSSQASVDVFGTEFQLHSTASSDLAKTTSRTQIWIVLIAGGAAAFGLYAALRSLTLSRASAIETARTADRERASLDRRFKASFDLAPIGMAELDAAGRLIAVNGALCSQIGIDRQAVLGRPLSTLVHEDDRPAHISRVESLLRGSAEAVQGEHRFHQSDGTDVWVHESISLITSDADTSMSWLVQSQDITAQRRAAWELAQQALHDDLTGLPNRALFLNRLKHSLVRADRHNSRVAVMFIDVDRFKVINDSLGHEMGDQFLVEIAERIGHAIRSGDTVARFGGDEFVVLCEPVSGESEATAAAQRIQDAFAEPFQLGEGPTYATASIGITLSTNQTDSADSLLRDADAAMYRAKDSGRNRAELFDYSMRSTIVARMEIESQLRTALENGEIVMHYQAIVDPMTHEPGGYEALIRWNHPEKGLLGPGAFLAVAEEAGLIHLIDSFALRSTCQQIAKWVREYPVARNLYLTTNWSARHLGRFVQQVEQVLGETNINPHQLVIEVTEGFLLEDSEGSVETLQQLKQLGVQIAIDDFGTGYSSLAYLTQFAVDYLKIDRSFVSKLPEDEASAAVIGAIADMATRLGIKLVAEGVETDEQIAMLASLGSPRLQGYRFAKPRPAQDIEQHLAERSGLLESVVRDAEQLLAMPPIST